MPDWLHRHALFVMNFLVVKCPESPQISGFLDFCSEKFCREKCSVGCSNPHFYGFQSPAQDRIEHVVDLARVLDLQKPGIYPVRVSGQAFAARGIRDGDILIANTAARPAHGKVAVAVLQAAFAML